MRSNMTRLAPPLAPPPSAGRLELVLGDGRKGWPAGAPYDAIHVGAAAPRLPLELVEQLAPGGRLVVPLGPEGGVQVGRWGSPAHVARCLLACVCRPCSPAHRSACLLTLEAGASTGKLAISAQGPHCVLQHLTVVDKKADDTVVSRKAMTVQYVPLTSRVRIVFWEGGGGPGMTAACLPHAWRQRSWLGSGSPPAPCRIRRSRAAVSKFAAAGKPAAPGAGQQLNLAGLNCSAAWPRVRGVRVLKLLPQPVLVLSSFIRGYCACAIVCLPSGPCLIQPAASEGRRRLPGIFFDVASGCRTGGFSRP
jgi:hypothetical protein